MISPDYLLCQKKFYRLISTYFVTSLNDSDNYNFGSYPLFENNALYITKASSYENSNDNPLQFN